MDIIKVREEDAQIFLELLTALDNETKYMMYEKDERSQNIDDIKDQIRNVNKNGIILALKENEKMLGYISGQIGDFRRIKHSAYIVMGIKQVFSGRGYGSLLIDSIFEWALANKLKRLELTVMVHNSKALNLYEKKGFKVEGLKKHSLLIDNEKIDEYYMAKLFD